VDGGSSQPDPYRSARKRRPAVARTVFFSVSAAALVAVLVIGSGVLLPFLLAVLVGYVLFPAVRYLERRTKLPRWVAILLVYAVAIGGISGFGAAVVPRLFAETKNLSAELPKLTDRVRDDLLPRVDATLQQWAGVDQKTLEREEQAQAEEASAPPPPPIIIKPLEDGSFEVHVKNELHVRKQRDGSYTISQQTPTTFSSALALRSAFDRAVAYAQTNSLELLKLGRTIVASVSRGIFLFFITLMLAGYMMFTFEDIHGFIREMWLPHQRESFDRFVHRLDRGFAGVVRGQLLICLVNGVLSAIGFWIFDLKYWPILSLIAGLMSIIPIFGSILSSIPVVAIGLTQSFGTAVGVLVWILAIHQLEANFLNPKIIGDQAKIHPVLVVFSLLVGEHLFQITGALLAVPCLALVQAVFLHFRESVLGIPLRTSMPPPPPDDDEEGVMDSVDRLVSGDGDPAMAESRAD
jgi:predicted PurR-regulated permease PerM